VVSEHRSTRAGPDHDRRDGRLALSDQSPEPNAFQSLLSSACSFVITLVSPSSASGSSGARDSGTERRPMTTIG
jgi:hypothetical protein